MDTVIELLVWVSAVAVPLAFIRPVGRIAFFVLGLLFFLVIALSPIGSAGLHGEGIVFAIPGLIICVAVILAEVAVRLLRLARMTAPG